VCKGGAALKRGKKFYRSRFFARREIRSGSRTNLAFTSESEMRKVPRINWVGAVSAGARTSAGAREQAAHAIATACSLRQIASLPRESVRTRSLVDPCGGEILIRAVFHSESYRVSRHESPLTHTVTFRKLAVCSSFSRQSSARSRAPRNDDVHGRHVPPPTRSRWRKRKARCRSSRSWRRRTTARRRFIVGSKRFRLALVAWLSVSCSRKPCARPSSPRASRRIARIRWSARSNTVRPARLRHRRRPRSQS